MNAGDIINDRYRLNRFIGQGSFGEVWLAEDMTLNIPVAIKIYISLDSKGLEEFKNEYKNVRHLNHPNLLRPEHFGHLNNKPYLIMAYCPERVGDKTGKLSEPDIWKLIYDISMGLAYLHSHEIVHRDIKPDNILKNENGDYVISDFGLSTKMKSTLRKASKRTNSESNQSGTIAYMAPELFESSPLAVKATDIWALGSTIYEVSTGELPFCGQGGIMEKNGAQLPELPNKYSRELDSLMKQCLAKDTWDRPTAKVISNIALKNLGKINEENQPVIKNKKLKKYKIALWCSLATVAGLIVWLVVLNHYYREMTDEYIKEWLAHDNLDRQTNDFIDSLLNVCLSETSEMKEIFPDWKSSNHSHDSSDEKYIRFRGYQGDIISFDYDVDSESYDHFKVTLKYNDEDKQLADIYGRNKKGKLTYTLPASGIYHLSFLYDKDNSVSEGRDEVSVSNITFLRSPLAKVGEGLIRHQYKNFDISRIDTVNCPYNPILMESEFEIFPTPSN